jgi:hypothetical protein
MKAILAGRNASLNIAQIKVSAINKKKFVTREYKKRNIPVENKEIFIILNVPTLSLSFPENGAEMNAPIPYAASTSPAFPLDTFKI